ncbi:MAG: hypothetical protein ACE5EZ_06710 [Thermodesulfobacteriota bacterium]
MKKQRGRWTFFPGSFVFLLVVAASLALYGCGGEEQKAPADGKAAAPVSARGEMPAGHPSTDKTTDDIAKASHSLIKTKKTVKISEEVRKKWTSAKLEIADLQAQASKTVELKVGSTTQLTDDGYHVKVEVFVPDYTIVGDHIESRSNEPNNPAVLIALLKGDKVETRGWVFTQLPEFNSFNDQRFQFALKAPGGKADEKSPEKAAEKAPAKAH